MSLLARYRLSLALVALALTGTAGVFTFLKPEYRPPGCNGCSTFVFPDAQPPAHGWTWAAGPPGFHFGEHHDEWNVSLLKPSELVPAARGAGILETERTEMHVRPAVLFAKGRCIGAQVERGSPTIVCPPTLERALAVVIAEWRPHSSLFLIGVARAEVTRVAATWPGATETEMRGATRTVRPLGPQAIYDRKLSHWWGTFAGTGLAGHALVKLVFYGAGGRRLAVERIRFVHAGERVVVFPY